MHVPSREKRLPLLSGDPVEHQEPQILNAESFEHQGFSMVLSEEELAPSILLPAIHKLYEQRGEYIAAMEKSEQSDAISTITQLIQNV